MEQTHAEPNYMAIFYWLAALTAIEVGVVYLGLPKFLLVSILVILAFTKAALVAMYFMHLKFERHTLAMVALTPVALCIFLIFMLMPDRHDITGPAVSPPAQSTTTH